MRVQYIMAVLVLCGVLGAGCVKRPPANVFPGSQDYEARAATLKITPQQAYNIAHEAAQTDNRMQFLSRRPTVLMKHTYVFSMPQPSGASLRGYHVNGDTGEVKFVEDNKTVAHTVRK